MISLQRRLVIFVLLVACAPLYVLLRYFQGKSFFNMAALALVINLGFAAVAMLFEGPLLRLGPPLTYLYDPDFSLTLGKLALYVLPLHLLWVFFRDAVGDTRHDLDDSGRFPLPIHPWLIDFPAALALPVAIYYADRLPVIVSPSWLPFTLPTVAFSSEWLYPAIAMSASYLAVAVLATRPIRLRRRRKLDIKPAKLRFDLVRPAKMPGRSREKLAHIFSRRSPELKRLTSPGP